MSSFIVNNKTITFFDGDDVSIVKELPSNIYSLREGKFGLYLEIEEEFKLPDKIYGDTIKISDRVKKTFNSRTTNTGVLLHGAKGSGKTLLTKYICNDLLKTQNLPVIKVNKAFDPEGFSSFMNSLKQEVVVLFDEFEKTHPQDRRNEDNPNPQQTLLSLFDGVYNSKKLFLLTCNDSYGIDDHFKNRPGRIYYSIEFSDIEKDVLEEYCKDNLVNKDNLESVIMMSNFYDLFTFDILAALVGEMNLHEIDAFEAIKYLNVGCNSDNDRLYKVTVVKNGKVFETNDKERLNPTSSRDYWFDDIKGDRIFEGTLTPDMVVKVDLNIPSYTYQFDKDTLIIFEGLYEKDFNLKKFLTV